MTKHTIGIAALLTGLILGMAGAGFAQNSPSAARSAVYIQAPPGTTFTTAALNNCAGAACEATVVVACAQIGYSRGRTLARNGNAVTGYACY